MITQTWGVARGRSGAYCGQLRYHVEAPYPADEFAFVKRAFAPVTRNTW